MKQKVSLLIGVVAIVIIILLSIKRPPIVPEHPKLDGTNAVRIPVDTRSLIPVISVHSISNLQYRRQS